MTTAGRCVPCATRSRTRAATPGYTTCEACSMDIRDDLADIRDRWTTLTADIELRFPNTGDGPGARSVPHSKSPANDHAIALTDPRTMPLAALGFWARMVAEDTGQTIADTTIPGLVGYLTHAHAHITRQTFVDDYAAELHTLAYALRLVTPDPRTGIVDTRPRPIGRCPNTIDRGDTTEECGADLYAPLHGDTITCRVCDRAWPRREWLRLGKILETT